MGVGFRVEAALRFAGRNLGRTETAGRRLQSSALLSLEQLREPSIGRESLDRGAELCARVVIGGQVQSDQRGKEADRGIAPGMLAQPLEDANVRLQ